MGENHERRHWSALLGANVYRMVKAIEELTGGTAVNPRLRQLLLLEFLMISGLGGVRLTMPEDFELYQLVEANPEARALRELFTSVCHAMGAANGGHVDNEKDVRAIVDLITAQQ